MSIKKGEDAISFFAKVKFNFFDFFIMIYFNLKSFILFQYGNTTPIKFINCVRDDNHPPEVFRPYDLKTINRMNEN